MKRFVIMLMLLAAVSPSLTGCFGKFALTRNIYELNASVHDRYLRNVVTWAFIFVPVYWVAGVVDLFVFNTIEFWSGQNPMTAGAKTFHYTSGDQLFTVLATKNGSSVSYTIDRYRNGQYQDTLAINHDLADGVSAATYRQPGKVTEYAARGSGDSMGAVLAGNRQNPETSLSLLYEKQL